MKFSINNLREEKFGRKLYILTLKDDFRCCTGCAFDHPDDRCVGIGASKYCDSETVWKEKYPKKK